MKDVMTNLPKELYNYSDRLVTELIPLAYPITLDGGHLGGKPCGLWFSVEDYQEDQTWKTWCEDEKFHLECLSHRHKITLSPGAKILWLKTTDEIVDFSLKYKGNDPEHFEKFRNPYVKQLQEEINKSLGRRTLPYIYLINWQEVKAEFDGIIIAPYNWELRMDLSWYYGWDCASGCLWDLTCIEEFKKIEIDTCV